MYTSIVLSNHPVTVLATENLFLKSVRQDVTNRYKTKVGGRFVVVTDLRDLGFTVSQTEDQSSTDC